ncbi:single-stranded nucleic acid binding R3H domain protein [Segniliparus rotundus DSM 44985]|uniref:Single-stranded nucleic acid binding R3H domain protein n=1 Tax=Segniliparus rotundus (strain ATCC BAA-972 / CDC 1076 / CIP 108378 / DSM 44985 / JCM 13578) TaxID=640132 RepID=D6ZEL9_SEGRD|nr:R3H domain-containing nucleic acid-binding protein [Segniliparus rotundus]ADG99495.1 single-stranded nucleic acid binding R3H domain protein [Segniliparus rotundus DSM 44985]
MTETETELETAQEQTESAAEGPDPENLLVEEGEIAGDYLEHLLDLLDYDGDLDLDVVGGRAAVSLEGGRDLQKLVGKQGEVLDALQTLTRLTVQQQTGQRSWLMLDIAKWRAQRKDDLHEVGLKAAADAVNSGQRVALTPMSPFERKVVHDAVTSVPGARSESEGEEPNRYVVVLPESAPAAN